MFNKDPDTPEEWQKLALDNRRAAEQLFQVGSLNGLAWSHAGFSIECLLKGAIHRKKRFNTWPRDRKDLRTHDLQKLMTLLDVTIGPDHEIAAEWAVVLQWRRGDMYNPDEFSEATVSALMEAVFGDRGVEQWITRNFLVS